MPAPFRPSLGGLLAGRCDREPLAVEPLAVQVARLAVAREAVDEPAADSDLDLAVRAADGPEQLGGGARPPVPRRLVGLPSQRPEAEQVTSTTPTATRSAKRRTIDRDRNRSRTHARDAGWIPLTDGVTVKTVPMGRPRVTAATDALAAHTGTWQIAYFHLRPLSMTPLM